MGGEGGGVCKPSHVHHTLSFLTKQQSAWHRLDAASFLGSGSCSTQYDLSQMTNFLLPQISHLYC